MGELNRVILVGFLGLDPKISEKVVRLSVATHHKVKDQRITDWHNVIVFGELMNIASQLKKGNQVVVEGKVTYSKYNDQYRTSIIATYLAPILTDEEKELKQTNPNNHYNAAVDKRESYQKKEEINWENNNSQARQPHTTTSNQPKTEPYGGAIRPDEDDIPF